MRGNPRSSYAAYGKYQIEKELLKEFRNDKTLILEDEVSSVFVIINAWEAESGATGEIVVDSMYYGTEEAAITELALIALGQNVQLEPGATSYIPEPPPHGIDFEECYIQELTQG